MKYENYYVDCSLWQKVPLFLLNIHPCGSKCKIFTHGLFLPSQTRDLFCLALLGKLVPHLHGFGSGSVLPVLPTILMSDNNIAKPNFIETFLKHP